MEDMQSEHDAPVALHLSDTLDRNSSRPQSLAKQNWNDLKSTIRELYLDQGQTLKHLANYLEEHHGFRPTKKQLLYRISGWGFEKNVKKNERRAIIKNLGSGLGKVEFEAQVLRGRTLNEAKLNRWMKMEKATFVESLVANSELARVPATTELANQDAETREPTQTSNHEEQSEFDIQVQESQNVAFLCNNDNSFDWNSVDVIGSPRLTKLIGALTIEECDIQLLDLASDGQGAIDILRSDSMDLCGRSDSAREENITCRTESWSTKLSTLIKTYQQSHFRLQFELYPFPISSNKSYKVHPPRFFGASHQPKISESECKIRLQKLKHMQDNEIIALVEAMGARAMELFHQRCYDTAETWFRRVVRAKKLVSWYKPHQTLWTCLRVCICVEQQDRYREAQALHQSLHGAIERVFGPDHGISVQSMILSARLFGDLGFKAEEEAVYRQMLQILLTTLGGRHPTTVDTLEELGSFLARFGRNGEAQPLLETSLHFRIEAVKNSGGPWMDGDNILWGMAELAEVLSGMRRYDESEKVLNCAQNLLGNETRQRYASGFNYHFTRARTYRLQKRLKNSEEILRGLLKFYLNDLGAAMAMESMRQLAVILKETGRLREAAFWYKKEYLLHVKTYGLTHRYTMECCEEVGFCYSDQRRYHKGKLFFEAAIEKIGLSSEEPDSRTTCIQKIKFWMKKLEEERVEDDCGSENSESVNSEIEPMDTDDDVDYEDMSDVPDPLDY
ncbi:hypothetical protein L207DRAFT_584081 [Hyaloscypha variabilis F]|uniref:Clr5 domain-containing protein n=1 Tax=Hyaloscypha variabilis (strain UAMH 11265 / GT02V1 / F) TaxID=1149755 RepID=A0A2J6RJL3_HYAVF|nr:hypothetical protein L207DRAFT_584081 [Hyaloscypha variabilis F]